MESAVELTPAANSQSACRPSKEEQAVAFRCGMLANGFEGISVRTGDKRPVGNAWENGEVEGAFLNPTPRGLNTGLLTRGLRAIDIDVDDRGAVAALLKLAMDSHLVT
jgi:hypothetical protein